MNEQRYTTSPTPHITVEVCGADLSITGTAASEVVVVFGADDGSVQREGESLRVTARDDCRIACPPATSITLRSVSGDLSAIDLNGTFAVESVGGDVSLRGAGVVSLQSVGGDLSARDVGGDLRIESVGGDLKVRRVDGQVIIRNAGGDLSARSLKGGAEIARVAGDASIETSLSAGKTYRISAGGDMTLRLPSDTSARFNVRAGGELDNRIEFGEWSGDEHAGQGVMGSGDAQVELSAGGDLLILPLRSDVDWDAIGSQIDAKMGQFERELDGKMNELSAQIARLTAAGMSELESRLRRVDIQKVTRRAEQAAERARQQALRTAERARRRAERRSRAHGFGFSMNPPAPPAAPFKPAKPAAESTEAERLMILRMLQERKISADEAAKLLEALEA